MEENRRNFPTVLLYRDEETRASEKHDGGKEKEIYIYLGFCQIFLIIFRGRTRGNRHYLINSQSWRLGTDTPSVFLSQKLK